MTTVQGILPQWNTTLIKIREESGDPGMVLPLTQLCMRPPWNRQNFLSFPFDCLFCNCQRISQQDRKRHPFSFWALANCQWTIYGVTCIECWISAYHLASLAEGKEKSLNAGGLILANDYRSGQHKEEKVRSIGKAAIQSCSIQTGDDPFSLKVGRKR